jgi:hypothetical protein
VAAYEEIVAVANVIRNAFHNGDLEFVFNPSNNRDVDAVEDGDTLTFAYREVEVVKVTVFGNDRDCVRVHLTRESWHG